MTYRIVRAAAYAPTPARHQMTDDQKEQAAAETRDAAPTERSEAHEKTLENTDDLLAEIDEALDGLELQAEVFVRNFVNKGGQ